MFSAAARASRRSLRGHVEQALRVGVRVDRGQQAALDAEAVEQHLGDRRQAVGRARRVRDDGVLGGIEAVLVDAQDDGDVLVAGGRRDDDFLGAGVDVRFGLGGVGEEAGGLDDDLRARASSTGWLPGSRSAVT